MNSAVASPLAEAPTIRIHPADDVVIARHQLVGRIVGAYDKAARKIRSTK